MFCQCFSRTCKYLSFFKDSYRTLASNLSTTTDNLLECGREALGPAANEYVIDFKLQFAEVGEGFHSVTSPTVTVEDQAHIACFSDYICDDLIRECQKALRANRIAS